MLNNNVKKDFDLKDLQIATVDYEFIFKVYNSKLTIDQNILKLNNVPEDISYHKYVFDMGYPYYMKYFNKILAITTDIGVCVI